MATPFDPDCKFVRLIETKPNGFVEFEFSVGEPGLTVELILPRAAFEEFCARNAVTFLSGDKPGMPPGEGEWDWNLRQATQQRFR